MIINIATCPDNSKSASRLIPSIKIDNGQLRFNKSAKNILSLSTNTGQDRIAFELIGNDLYMYWDKTMGFPIRYYKSDKSFRIANNVLYAYITKHYKSKNVRLMINEFNEGKYKLTPF